MIYSYRADIIQADLNLERRKLIQDPGNFYLKKYKLSD
jgi:hypothetical protein